MHKKILSIIVTTVLVIGFCFSLTSCKQKTDSEVAHSHEITGEVMEANGKDITIELDDETLLTFDYETAKTIDKGIKGEHGQVATIAYDGELDGTDTSDCTVTYVIILAGEEKEITGKLTDYNDDASTVSINDGSKSLTFDVANAERHYKDGIQIGNTLEICYTGKIRGTDTSKVTVHSVIDDDINVKDQKENSKVRTVDETVWTKDTVNVREGSSTAAKIITTFKKGKKVKRTGILDDGWSRISYKGRDCYIVSAALTKKNPDEDKTTESTTKEPTTEPTTEQPTVEPTTQEPTAEPTTQEPTTESADVKSPLKGTIKALVAGEETTKLTLDADNGQTYIFDVSKASIHLLDGDTVGAKVIVVFTGSISGTDTSKCTVTSVTSQ